MTDDRRGFFAYYAVLVGVTLIAMVAFAVALVLLIAGIEWAVGVVLWLSDNPDERDLATIGALALLALIAGEYRRRR